MTATTYQTLYAIDESQLRAIMRLTDAARLLSLGLPPTYTRTPMGVLSDLADAVSAITIFAKTMEACDECGASPAPTIRCVECDIDRCHRCYYAHKH